MVRWKGKSRPRKPCFHLEFSLNQGTLKLGGFPLSFWVLFETALNKGPAKTNAAPLQIKEQRSNPLPSASKRDLHWSF